MKRDDDPQDAAIAGQILSGDGRDASAQINIIGKPWKKGRSGNPGGRPRIPQDVRELLRDSSPGGVRRLLVLAGITTDGRLRRTSAPHAVQVAAVNSLMDRTFGKAPTPIVTLDASGAGTPDETLRALRMALLGALVPPGDAPTALPATIDATARQDPAHAELPPAADE